MMKKVINALFLLSLLVFSSAVSLAGTSSVSAEGDSEFYYSGTNGESNAKYLTKQKLFKLCKKKGMMLYEGKYGKESYSLIHYSGLKCKEKKGEKKCSVKASGVCVSKNSEYFSIKCNKGKKSRVVGRSELLRGGGLRVIADNGSVYNINRATILDDGGHDVLCSNSVDESNKFINKMKKHLLRYVESHQKNCKAIITKAEKTGDNIPRECKSSNNGGVRN